MLQLTEAEPPGALAELRAGRADVAVTFSYPGEELASRPGVLLRPLEPPSVRRVNAVTAPGLRKVPRGGRRHRRARRGGRTLSGRTRSARTRSARTGGGRPCQR